MVRARTRVSAGMYTLKLGLAPTRVYARVPYDIAIDEGSVFDFFGARCVHQGDGGLLVVFGTRPNCGNHNGLVTIIRCVNKIYQ